MRALILAAMPLCTVITTSAAAQSSGTVRRADAERLPGRVVDVSAGAFFLRSPDSIPAGLTTFRLSQVGGILTNPEKVMRENVGLATPVNDRTRAFHMLWILRLVLGRPVDERYQANIRNVRRLW